MNSTAEQKRPRWLDEEPTLQLLLSKFLDKIENTQRLTMRVNAKTLPELFDPNSEDLETLWAYIEYLDTEYHILTIKMERVKAYQPIYDNAQITFVAEKESVVRAWLNRPRLDPYALLWDKYLKKFAAEFEDYGAALDDNCIRVSHKSPEHILKSFASIGRVLQQPMTLRALSARCFWGDSKFLDRKEELVLALFPSAKKLLSARPILLNCYIPNTIERILFIENQDSFLALVDAEPSTTALIYSAGFRGSATRIRENGNARFTQTANSINAEAMHSFERWWFGVAEQNWPVSFWGDLDYAGAAILKTLKQSFTTISAWQPGYQRLLQKLENSEGHGHNTCCKENQKDPIHTGCPYMDNDLLPAMRERGIFIDQEAVLSAELEGFR